MGVKGLLSTFKSVIVSTNISKYAGKTIAIDASGWLYKGLYTCAKEFFLAKKSDRYLHFCMAQINILKSYDITPIVVFDGALIPTKEVRHRQRADIRTKHRSQIFQAMKQGEIPLNSSFLLAIEITNDMKRQLIQLLSEQEIQSIVAPYEADAQLGYMSREKMVDAVISEDSDCIPYGCNTLLCKWKGNAPLEELKAQNIFTLNGPSMNFQNWTQDMFLVWCILAGGDYCQTVHKIGVVTANKIVNEYKTPEAVLEYLILTKQSVLPPDYPQQFVAAYLTYRHHLIFDPRDNTLKTMTPISDISNLQVYLPNASLSFLGNIQMTNDIAKAIAYNEIHPTTYEKYEIASSYYNADWLKSNYLKTSLQFIERMGIPKLLPVFKSIIEDIHISKYAGKTVGIDAYGWLYKGSYSCALDIVLENKTNQYLDYCFTQLKVLQSYNVTPIFVFDGAPLPAKLQENSNRNRDRLKWKRKVQQAIKNDEIPMHTDASRALSVTNEMAMTLIKVLRKLEIQYIVAPYEADAQLAFLSRQRIVDAIISEDSDCLPYGCKTMLFKWSPDGWANELKRRNLGTNEGFSFVEWSEEMFLSFCVLAGCDYCQSIPGVGIVTAYNYVKKYKSPKIILDTLEKEKTLDFPAAYREQFSTAILTFRHHLVFDPRDKKLKMLSAIGESSQTMLNMLHDTSLSFLGDMQLSNEVVSAIADARVHPITHESYAWKEKEEEALATLRNVNSIESSSDLDGPTSLEFGSKSSTHSFTSSESSVAAIAFPKEGYETDHVQQKKRRKRARVTNNTNSNSNIISKSSSFGEKNSHDDRIHLDNIIGASSHVINFKSPKVSENFRPLIALPYRRPAFHAEKTAINLRQEFETQPIRQNLKRVRNPLNRKQANDLTSGFAGEVSCRVVNSIVLNPFESTSRNVASVIPRPPTVTKSISYKNEQGESNITTPAYLNSLQISYDEENLQPQEIGKYINIPEKAFPVYARAKEAEEKWDKILCEELNRSQDNYQLYTVDEHDPS